MSEKFLEYLVNQWLHILKILFNPWTVSSIVIGYWIVSKYPNSVFISIWTSIVGGVIATLWFNFSEDRKIVVRGKMAMRSLTGLFNTIISSQDRIENHIGAIKAASDVNYTLPLQHLEEMNHLLKIFKEETTIAIKAWMDVVPDAEKIDIVQDMVALRRQIAELSKDLIIATKERDDAKQKSSDLESQYSIREQELSKQIHDLVLKLNAKSREIRGSTLSGITGTADVSFGFGTSGAAMVTEPLFTGFKCKRCGKTIPEGSKNTDYCLSCERRYD